LAVRTSLSARASSLSKAAIAGALLGVLPALTVAGPAFANHSVPNPRWGFDCNGNHVIDDACITVEKTGPGWDTARVQRFQSAIVEWWSKTDYDPMAGTGPYDAFADGRDPRCGNPFTDGGAYARTCIDAVWDDPGGFWRIFDVDLYFNTDGHTWYTGTGSNLNRVDFRGVATHELGHFARLIDLSQAVCGPINDPYTMCGNADTTDTYRIRDLESDDITSANNLY
jgi:hypothetical protein